LTVKVAPAIVKVPLRAAVVVFAAALMPTVPLPLPLAPDVTLNHVSLLAAVHGQPVPAVTLTVPVPPAAVIAWLVGLIAYVHAAAAWLTVKVAPAIVKVPLREVVAVFAAALIPTVPLPLPLAPEVTLSHVSLLAAVHAQPAPAVTPTLPVPPAAVIAWLVGLIAYEHAAAA
jgi:hypothetical protein